MKPSFVTFETQAEFPVEDISQQNASLAKYYLEHAVEARTCEQADRQNLYLFHELANAALRASDVNPNNNRGEYLAFCSGVTKLEFLATLLASRRTSEIRSGFGMYNFYLQYGEITLDWASAESEVVREDVSALQLSIRREYWEETHQNTIGLLADTFPQPVTEKQYRAHILGAQMASELLYVDRPLENLDHMEQPFDGTE